MRRKKFPIIRNCKSCQKKFVAKCSRHIYCGSSELKIGCSFEVRREADLRRSKIIYLVKKENRKKLRNKILSRINPILVVLRRGEPAKTKLLGLSFRQLENLLLYSQAS